MTTQVWSRGGGTQSGAIAALIRLGKEAPAVPKGPLREPFIIPAEAWKRIEFVEMKGFEREAYKLKLKLFKALYPNDTYRVVKAWRNAK